MRACVRARISTNGRGREGEGEERLCFGAPVREVARDVAGEVRQELWALDGHAWVAVCFHVGMGMGMGWMCVCVCV